MLRPLATQFEPLYRQAAGDALRLLVEDDAAGAAVASLLAHFDNQLDRLESLLAGMLARRDQWLPITGAHLDTGAARAGTRGGAGPRRSVMNWTSLRRPCRPRCSRS